MKCSKCGAELLEGATVCEACGAAVEAATEVVESTSKVEENVAEVSKKSKKGLVIGLISAVVVIAAALVIVFCFVLKDKPKGLTGSYSGEDSWGDKKIFVFYEGTYVIYDDEISIDNVWEVGSYELKDSAIVFYNTTGEDYEYDVQYDEKEDAIIFNEEHLVGNDIGTVRTYKADNKKEKLDISISGDYISSFVERIDAAGDAAVAAYPEYERTTVRIDYDSLNEPEDDLYEIIAKEMNFKDDKTFRFMLESGTIDGIKLYLNNPATVEFFFY